MSCPQMVLTIQPGRRDIIPLCFALHVISHGLTIQKMLATALRLTLSRVVSYISGPGTVTCQFYIIQLASPCPYIDHLKHNSAGDLLWASITR